MYNKSKISYLTLALFLLAPNLLEAAIFDRLSTKVVKPSSRQKSPKGSENTLLYADEIIHEKESGLITALGHVEIEREGRVLRADVVTYNNKTDIMTASGHVRLDETSGETIYVDYAELTGDMKTGFVTQARIMLSDNARLVANKGDRKNAEITHFTNVLYSPCNLCKVNPQKPPFWQVKAKHAVYDEKAEDIYYTDALIEMFGIPTFYMPYLRHPAPKVKRRTGFLGLTIGQSTDLGWYGLMEYFWVLSRDKDITLTPMIRTNGRGVLGLQYRQRLEKGEMSLTGSIDPGSKVVDNKGKTLKESDRVRWHVVPEAKYEFTEHIRGSLHIERTSDQTYLRRYPHLGSTDRSFLTSNVRGEGFWGRSYGVVQGYSFQGLREGDTGKTTPLLLPWMNINYLGKPDRFGGRWSIEGDGLALTRQEGTKYNRLSTTGGWQKPHVSTWGEVYTFGVKLRGDVYEVKDYKPPQQPTLTYNTTLSRVFPQAYANWSYPFFRNWRSYRVVLEPLLGLVTAPALNKPTKLPDQDGGLVEFNDAVLMSESRFAGLDRIDGGSRLNFGLNLSGFSKAIGHAGLFVGQSLAFQEPQKYLANTGLDKRLSDVVARLKYNYTSWLSFKTRFLLERQTRHFRRNETSTSIGQPILRLTATYTQSPIPSDSKILSSKQAVMSLSSAFHENWTASVTTTRDLGKQSRTLSQGVSLTFQNECFIFANTLTKTFYNDRDLRPDLTYMFRISFKNLGDFAHTLGTAKEPGQNVYLL